MHPMVVSWLFIKCSFAETCEVHLPCSSKRRAEARLGTFIDCKGDGYADVCASECTSCCRRAARFNYHMTVNSPNAALTEFEAV